MILRCEVVRSRGGHGDPDYATIEIRGWSDEFGAYADFKEMEPKAQKVAALVQQILDNFMLTSVPCTADKSTAQRT